jgi:hypothetical protein
MTDTIGSLVDKLGTVDMKLWNQQSFVYEIRKMSWEDFQKRCVEDEKYLHKFYDSLQKATDLNLQRNALIDEIDTTIAEMIQSGLEGKELDNGKYIQRKNKLY